MIKMTDALRVYLETIRLADVMQQRRQPEVGLRRNGIDCRQCVMPDIVDMMWVPLLEALHRQQFRQEYAENGKVGI